MYYNTNGLTGDALLKQVNKTENQKGKVLFLCWYFKSKILTARRIWYLYDRFMETVELTSIRRAISDLVEAGDLEYGGVISFECPKRKGFKTQGNIVKWIKK